MEGSEIRQVGLLSGAIKANQWWASPLMPALGLLVLVSAACRDRPRHSVVVTDPYPAPPLSVTRPSGERYLLAADSGKVVLLHFGYSQCPDFCPVTLTDWQAVKRALGRREVGVRFVFVSIDPERDTPEAIDAWVRQFDSSFVGLAPPREELDVIKRAWGVVAYQNVGGATGGPPGRYTMAHPDQTYLINRAGRLQALYPPETRWQDLAADLKAMF